MLDSENRYPHLLPIDADIWRQHHLKFDNFYHSFEYDISVGDGRDPGPGFEPNIRDMAIRLSCRRIDVVAHRADSTDIIEVTHSAGFTALGQLLAYPILYRLKFPKAPKLRAFLVAGEIQTDIKPVLDKLGITYIEYGAPDSPPKRRSPAETP